MGQLNPRSFAIIRPKEGWKEQGVKSMRGELYIKAVACAALLGIVGMGCKSNDNAGLTSIPSFAGSGNNPGGGNPNTGPGNGNDTVLN